MEMDSRTIAFLAVAAFMSLLLLCCIVLSVLFYIRYRNCEASKDDRESIERQRINRLKGKLMKQFKNDLKKQTSKRQGKVAPHIHADDTDTACSICIDSLAEGDPTDIVLLLLIKCGHVYHMDCVWPWLERDHSCPICRRDIDLSISDLQAVTVYHVYNNFDVPSIRESVSRADLHSRLNYDGLDIVSINEDDLKTPRSDRSSRVVAEAPSDMMTDSVMTAQGSSGNNNGINHPTVDDWVNNTRNGDLSRGSSSIVDNSLSSGLRAAPAIFTIGGMDNDLSSIA